MGFFQLVFAIAIGVGIPLFIFMLWISSRLDWYLGSVVPRGLDKISEECSGIRSYTSRIPFDAEV
jgi:hypothetical protein